MSVPAFWAGHIFHHKTDKGLEKGLEKGLRKNVGKGR